MNENRYKIYDSTVANSIRLIYNEFKREGKITLDGFEPTNKEHMYIHAIASIACGIYGYEFYLRMPLIKYLKFHRSYKRGKLTTKPGMSTAYLLDMLYKELNDIELYPNGLGEIFDEYYKIKD